MSWHADWAELHTWLSSACLCIRTWSPTGESAAWIPCSASQCCRWPCWSLPLSLCTFLTELLGLGDGDTSVWPPLESLGSSLGALLRDDVDCDVWKRKRITRSWNNGSTIIDMHMLIMTVNGIVREVETKQLWLYDSEWKELLRKYNLTATKEVWKDFKNIAKLPRNLQCADRRTRALIFHSPKPTLFHSNFTAHILRRTKIHSILYRCLHCNLFHCFTLASKLRTAHTIAAFLSLMIANGSPSKGTHAGRNLLFENRPQRPTLAGVSEDHFFTRLYNFAVACTRSNSFIG